MDDNIKKVLSELNKLEKLKEEFNGLEGEITKNPEAFLETMGYNLEEFKGKSPKEFQEMAQAMQSISNNLLKQTESLEAVFNKDSREFKIIENYSKKIKAQGGEMSHTDMEKMMGFMSAYIKSETKNVGSCFHYDTENCSKTVIDAHSLQKKGPLKSIASEKGGVVFIEKDAVSGNRKPIEVKTVQASTFKGFCHTHDAIFQKSIETCVFDSSLKHMFLHSYRSFAYSYHTTKQSQDYMLSFVDDIGQHALGMLDSISRLTEVLGGNTALPVQSLHDLQLTDEQKEILSITRYEEYKGALNESLRDGKYDDLDYFVYTKKHVLPVACASWIKSHLRFGDSLVIEYRESIYHGYPIVVTLVPESRGMTHLVLARFKKDRISALLFSKLEKMKNKDITSFELTLSSLILRYVENLYISPKWWDTLDSYLKSAFIKEMNLWDSNFMELEPSQKVINLFSEIYKLEKTKT